MKNPVQVTLIILSMAATMTAAEREVYPNKSVPPEEETRCQVQITEIGNMRTLLLLDRETLQLEKLIAQRLTEVDFRVFPSASVVPDTAEGPVHVSADVMRKVGIENKADLVLYASAKVRPKNTMGDFQLYEGEGTVQIFSPVSGEMMVSQTNRANGTRSVDEVDAKRSAIEKAIDEATCESINRGLGKVHKIIVHRAIVTNVKDNERVLIIISYLQKMQGVYHVRQLSFDPKTHVLELEIMSAPRADDEWRAYLDRMPRTKVTVIVNRGGRGSQGPRKQYPPWFHPS